MKSNDSLNGSLYIQNDWQTYEKEDESHTKYYNMTFHDHCGGGKMTHHVTESSPYQANDFVFDVNEDRIWYGIQVIATRFNELDITPLSKTSTRKEEKNFQQYHRLIGWTSAIASGIQAVFIDDILVQNLTQLGLPQNSDKEIKNLIHRWTKSKRLTPKQEEEIQKAYQRLLPTAGPSGTPSFTL